MRFVKQLVGNTWHTVVQHAPVHLQRKDSVRVAADNHGCVHSCRTAVLIGGCCVCCCLQGANANQYKDLDASGRQALIDEKSPFTPKNN